MKKTTFYFAPDANQQTSTTSDTLANDKTTSKEAVDAIKKDVPNETEPEPTSEKLTQLRADYTAAFASMATLTNIADQQRAMLATFKINKEIESEILSLKSAQRELKNQMLRNERIALVDTLLNTYALKLKVDADKKSTEQERNEVNDAFVSASDVVKNELLARYATSKPSTSTSTDKPAGERGKIGSEIIATHQANLSAGMTATESKAAITASGHAVGTVGAVVLKWEREQGLK